MSRRPKPAKPLDVDALHTKIANLREALITLQEYEMAATLRDFHQYAVWLEEFVEACRFNDGAKIQALHALTETAPTKRKVK